MEVGVTYRGMRVEDNRRRQRPADFGLYATRLRHGPSFSDVLLVHHLPAGGETCCEMMRKFTHNNFFAFCANLYERETTVAGYCG
jgi:hypothetical protein